MPVLPEIEKPDVAVSIFLGDNSNWTISDLGQGLYRIVDGEARINVVGTLDNLNHTFSALLAAVYRVKEESVESETAQHVN